MVRLPRFISVCSLLLITGVAVWVYQQWRLGRNQLESLESAVRAAAAPVAADASVPVRLTRQARDNLRLTSAPLQPTNFWRTIELPGIIVDRPGVSNRGVAAPVTGVVTKINTFPGDLVEPDEPLFSIRLVSESLHASQMDLFKATQNIEIARGQLVRLSDAASSGALPKSRIIDVENEIKRLNVTVQAFEQSLRARGLSRAGIEAAARGDFVTEIVVRSPCYDPASIVQHNRATLPAGSDGDAPCTYEMQTLSVELGQQVESGELLCELADHQALFVEGRAFKDDMPLVQAAARNGWEVDIDFGSLPEGDWPELPGHLPIHYVANTVDPDTRTFAFYLALENHAHTYKTSDGNPRLLWRFRPGGRLRLRVPVEQLDNVFVVPREAVVQEGPEAYVFRQNGDLFDRRPVRVLHEDRLYAVLANDGSVRPGFYLAQNSAASLNRVLKAQSASGVPAGVHIHADGTVHGAH